MSFNSGLGMEASYYVATANPFTLAPKLDGEAQADVVVVGGGYTGLHAALNAAERGFSVILLEAGRIGWGASGRNGGQIIPGWRKGASELIARYGAETAKLYFDLALEARALTLDRITRRGIACDLHTNGHLTLAAKARDLDWMRAETDALARTMNYPHARVLLADEAAAKVAAPGFHGALLDEGGGQLHPLNYALGLAEAARGAGVRCTNIRAWSGWRRQTALSRRRRAASRVRALACWRVMRYLATSNRASRRASCRWRIIWLRRRRCRTRKRSSPIISLSATAGSSSTIFA